MPNFLETLVQNTASMLQRWHGHRARMLELTKSHASLRILVGDVTYGQNLFISCLGPLHICGSTEWEQSAITLKTLPLDSGQQGIVVIDEGGGLRIVAESCEVHENVKW